METPVFIIGHHPQRGPLWAAVDPNAKFVSGEIAGRRFTAYLAPFATEDEARAALKSAVVVYTEAEPGRRTRG